MEVTQAPNAAETPAQDRPGMSPFPRAVAVFTKPTGAWAGLQHQVQWWFPLLVMLVCSAIVLVAVYQRAVVPMNAEQFDRMIDAGRMTAEQAAQAEQRMSGPMGLVIGLVSQAVFVPIIMLLLAAGVAFGVSFIVGAKLPFRQAFEVVLWSNLVMIPAGFLTAILAWSKETMRGIHLGPGILVPMSDPPEKWQMGLGSFLDAFGPFEIWTVALVILGASALSGGSRKSITWAIVGLYLAARLLGAALAALFTPGA
jgi:Yip1 domain